MLNDESTQPIARATHRPLRPIGNGYRTAKSQHLFRDFIDAATTVTLTAQAIDVRFLKRAHNPLLLAAGYDRIDLKVPWLENRPMDLVFG